jgi:mannose-6-phosphate isomerase-like protein (cupin superfamily)
MANLFTDPIHLGLGAVADIQPPLTGIEWYADYSARTASDGGEGRLVTMYSFTESWDSWECHPHGDEVVLCTSGNITLHQELADGSINSVTLGPGDYAINAPGIWHTADVEREAIALFITTGMGTEHRAR